MYKSPVSTSLWPLAPQPSIHYPLSLLYITPQPSIHLSHRLIYTSPRIPQTPAALRLLLPSFPPNLLFCNFIYHTSCLSLLTHFLHPPLVAFWSNPSTYSWFPSVLSTQYHSCSQVLTPHMYAFLNTAMNYWTTIQPYTDSVHTWQLTLTAAYSSPPFPLACLLSALLGQLPQ